MNNISATYECAPNIALIKYWGKSDDELIIPLNGSISITLDTSVLSSRTTILLIKSNSHKIYVTLNSATQEIDDGDLNKSPDDLINKKRLFIMLDKVRQNCILQDPFEYEIRICSSNNFPTACGMASSASGFACLAYCLSKAFGYKGDVSELARLGSGSACRSCFGGFVKWNTATDSAFSLSRVLFPAEHWPQMNIVALILEDGKKAVSSTHGMKDTVLTSQLLPQRVKIVEEKRLKMMQQFIGDKNFDQFAKLVMQDSNSFHAVCLDTYPPLFYLNDKSKEIIQFINEFNKIDPELKVAYSFDAGPNCFLFVLDHHIAELLFLIKNIYLNNSDLGEKIVTSADGNFLKSLNFDDIQESRKVLLMNLVRKFTSENKSTIIKYLIHSKIGSGPVHCNENKSLLDLNALPK
ncbi:diphosphomevalonate decarboxylase [Brachionus plicatilis]|uniref:Diphosphomevalonate decarboxylase n=1 Tax=Brachionus plicatilis TaxID=10195 RepID=A0A3M7QR34_BRAPC|nr:diphosphomevalonate decarboxylase [Brachionus plicatilis]